LDSSAFGSSFGAATITSGALTSSAAFSGS
jgi:hypothetical protein